MEIRWDKSSKDGCDIEIWWDLFEEVGGRGVGISQPPRKPTPSWKSTGSCGIIAMARRRSCNPSCNKSWRHSHCMSPILYQKTVRHYVCKPWFPGAHHGFLQNFPEIKSQWTLWDLVTFGAFQDVGLVQAPFLKIAEAILFWCAHKMRVAELGRVRDLYPRSLGFQWNRLRPRSKMEQKQSMSTHLVAPAAASLQKCLNIQVAIASKASVQTISRENQDLLQMDYITQHAGHLIGPHRPMSSAGFCLISCAFGRRQCGFPSPANLDPLWCPCCCSRTQFAAWPCRFQSHLQQTATEVTMRSVKWWPR